MGISESAGRLAERLSDVDASIATVQGELDQVRAAKGDSSADDEHDPEGSTLSSDWSRIEGMLVAVDAQRTAIQLAFARLEAGTYGVCVDCGQAISAGRLEARPEAELCIECASQSR